jgi:hypothetical protein
VREATGPDNQRPPEGPANRQRLTRPPEQRHRSDVDRGDQERGNPSCSKKTLGR